MEGFEEHNNPRETNFLTLIKYLNAAIQNINDGDTQDAITNINLVLLKLNYNARYVAFFEIPEEMIIDGDSYNSDDPVFNEISKKITNISVLDSIIEDRTEELNNIDEHVKEMTNHIEEFKRLTSASNIDERKQILQENVDASKKERAVQRIELDNMLKNHPEFMEKLQNRVEDLDNTQENPE